MCACSVLLLLRWQLPVSPPDLAVTEAETGTGNSSIAGRTISPDKSSYAGTQKTSHCPTVTMIIHRVGLCILLMTAGASSEDQKPPEERPDTIYLPYSETEDVDFSVERPNNIGCYQW